MAVRFPSLAGWIPRPAPFDGRNYGTKVKLSEERSVAERDSLIEWRYGVVYTAQPVPVGDVWRITVLKTTVTWSGGLVSE